METTRGTTHAHSPYGISIFLKFLFFRYISSISQISRHISPDFLDFPNFNQISAKFLLNFHRNCCISQISFRSFSYFVVSALIRTCNTAKNRTPRQLVCRFFTHEIPELADSKYDYMYVWAMFYKRSGSCTCIGTKKPCCVALGGVRNTQRPIWALPWTGSHTSILVTHRAGRQAGDYKLIPS